MNPILDKIKNGALVLDVRTVDEFADGSYPGAVNIPVHILSAKLMDLGPKTRPVVVFCASGARSAMAAQILKKAGWDDVTNAGGLDDMPA
ncbi:MAG: rhodanese-like domain-containing protein [Spirochaetales bacterium]|nr:rhodanese-like domain-containing protein [Spirochaetales bacterium]